MLQLVILYVIDGFKKSYGRNDEARNQSWSCPTVLHSMLTTKESQEQQENDEGSVGSSGQILHTFFFPPESFLDFSRNLTSCERVRLCPCVIACRWILRAAASWRDGDTCRRAFIYVARDDDDERGIKLRVRIYVSTYWWNSHDPRLPSLPFQGFHMHLLVTLHLKFPIKINISSL